MNPDQATIYPSSLNKRTLISLNFARRIFERLMEIFFHENGFENTFGLERSLQEFLVENWKHTTLGNEWVLFEEDGEVVGSYYNTGEVGVIDLLAKHCRDKLWLVVELKKGRSSDVTVGQVLRYMGWVRRNLASEGENVKGLIISREIDRKLQYALDSQPNIKCMTYQVTFNLNNAPEL